MTNPVNRCLRKLDHASAVSDTTITALVADALNELEASYGRPGDRILALEDVLHSYSERRSDRHAAPFHRFLLSIVDQRQTALSRLAPQQVERDHRRDGSQSACGTNKLYV